MKKICLAIGLLLCISGIANAQPSQTASIQWNTTDTPAFAQALTSTLKIDAAAPVNLQPNCTLVNNVTTCTGSLSNYVPGVHTLVLTVSNASGSASATFSTSAGPAVPTAGKVIVIIIGN